jgi:hypothetical protein
MEQTGNSEVSDFTERQAVGVVYRCGLGLAIIVALVIPASIRSHDREISTFQFLESLVSQEEPATADRRDVFEARRLAYEARSHGFGESVAFAATTPANSPDKR